jgi:DNA-binding phage protein
MANYSPPIIAEAMLAIRNCGTPITQLAEIAGVSRESFYRWGQTNGNGNGNGATVGCLDAILRAAGYELRIAKMGEPR